jgi:ABC-type branched-subunit amino acid transport system substrate-binding protein
MSLRSHPNQSASNTFPPLRDPRRNPCFNSVAAFLRIGSAVLAAPAIALPAFAAQDIRLGSLLDLTDEFDAYGKPMKQGVDPAIEETKQTGGLLGRKMVNSAIKLANQRSSTLSLRVRP